MDERDDAEGAGAGAEKLHGGARSYHRDGHFVSHNIILLESKLASNHTTAGY
jgi:hypothetical protein